MVWSWKLGFLLQEIVDMYYALVLKHLKEGEVEVFVKKLVNTFFWIALGPLQQQDDGPNYEHNGVKNILNSQLILVFSTLLSKREICKQNFAKTLVNKNLYVRLQKRLWSQCSEWGSKKYDDRRKPQIQWVDL